MIPHLPTDWPEATLARLAVGDQTFTITASQSATEYSLQIQDHGRQDGGDGMPYALTLGFYLPADRSIAAVLVNGESVPWCWETTQAGRRLVCEAVGQAELLIKIGSSYDKQ